MSDEFLMKHIVILKSFRPVLLAAGIIKLQAIGSGSGDEGSIDGIAVFTEANVHLSCDEVQGWEDYNTELLEQLQDGHKIREIFESLDENEYDGEGGQTRLVYDVKSDQVTISQAYYESVLGDFMDRVY
jgi:hypothetical protein